MRAQPRSIPFVQQKSRRLEEKRLGALRDEIERNLVRHAGCGHRGRPAHTPDDGLMYMAGDDSRYLRVLAKHARQLVAIEQAILVHERNAHRERRMME